MLDSSNWDKWSEGLSPLQMVSGILSSSNSLSSKHYSLWKVQCDKSSCCSTETPIQSLVITGQQHRNSHSNIVSSSLSTAAQYSQLSVARSMADTIQQLCTLLCALSSSAQGIIASLGSWVEGSSLLLALYDKPASLPWQVLASMCLSLLWTQHRLFFLFAFGSGYSTYQLLSSQS